MKRTLLLLPAVAILATVAGAQSITENFDGGNVDDWGIDLELSAGWQAAGGNPGARLESLVSSSSSFLPAPMLWPRAAGHPWQGDFRAMNIDNFGYDRQVESGSSNFGTLSWFLIGNDNGTPLDFLDDTWIYTQTGDNFQFGMAPWATFDIPIPSSDQFMPANWIGNGLPNSPFVAASMDDIWNFVMTDASYIAITTGFPWNGGAWFGTHVISYDNFHLDGGVPIGANYCSPAVANSTGNPGTLQAFGSDVATDNDLLLIAADLPDGQFAYFIASQTQSFVPMAGGSQGNICVGGSVARFNAQVGPINGGLFSASIDLTSMPEPPTFNKTVLAGETWSFQCWYRDVNPNTTSNFTDGVMITYQ